MLNCPRCGADYSEQGLDGGRCRRCGNLVAWSMTAVPAAAFFEPAPRHEDLSSQPPVSDPVTPRPAAQPDSAIATSETLAAVALAPPPAAPASDGGTGTFATLPQLSLETGNEATERDAQAETIELQWTGHVEHERNLSSTIKTRATELTVQERLVIPRRAVRDSQSESTGARSDYELLTVIGRGGEGVVHAARQASIDRTVALKMIREGAATDHNSRQKFLSEAVVTGDLEHPNIVPIYDLGTTNDGSLFYVMKRIQGTPWSEVIQRTPLNENINILMRTADAVALAHSRGVVHRDLKPENVMLGDFGEVLLTDWGIALCTEKFAKRTSVVLASGLGGTPAYMAPEMATGPLHTIGPPADIYLLGAILFQIVTGKPPHHADTVMDCLHAAAKNEIQPTDAKGELIDIAFKAMATRPKDRFASVKEFQDAIKAYQSHSESVLLSEQSKDDLERARQTKSYDDFAAAVFGFQKAIDLWPHNVQARKAWIAARAEYAAAALAKGDLDLAYSLLDREQREHATLLTRVTAAQRERDTRQHRLQAFRYIAAALLLAIFIGGSYGFIKINHARDAANRARSVAINAWITADGNAAEANQQKLRAEEAMERAQEAAMDAAEAAEEAIIARNKSDAARAEAAAALRRAGEASYSSAIALAVSSIANHAFDDARDILLEQQSHAEQAALRHWEWGRQMYLSFGGDPHSPAGLAVDTWTTDSEALAVAVSPRRDRIAVTTLSGAVHLWQRDPAQPQPQATWAPLAVLPGEATINHAAFSPTGELLATAGEDGAIRIYQLDNLALAPREFRDHRGEVLAVDFSPTAEPPLLASSSGDRTVKLWTLDSEPPLRTLVGHTAAVGSVRFSRQGDRLVTASEDFTARIWSVETGQELQRFREHDEPVFCATFSADGAWVASGGYDKRILIWKADRYEPVEPTLVAEVVNRLRSDSTLPGKQAFRELIGHTASIRELQFSDDGNRLVSAARDNTLKVWEQPIPQDGEPLTPQSQRLGDADEVANDQCQTLRGHGGWVSSCAFLDADTVISTSYDHQVKLWRTSQYQEIGTLAEVERPILHATYAPDGRTVAVALDDGTAGIWDAESGAPLGRLEEGHDFLANTAVFLPGGERLVTIAGDDTLRLWDVRHGTEIWHVRGTGRRGLLALSPDGTQIVTGSDEGKIAQVWDADAGKQLRTLNTGRLEELMRQYPKAERAELQKQLPDVTAIAFSPDGSLIATGDSAGLCWLWPLADSEYRQNFRAHDHAITSLQWLDEGAVLVTASADGSIAFWDVATGTEMPGRRLRHADAVSLLDVSTDGTEALSVAADGRGGQHLYHWDLTNRQLLARYPDDSPRDAQVNLSPGTIAINSIMFSPDQAQALVATFDTRSSRYEIQQWDLTTGRFGPINERDLQAGIVFSAVYAQAAAQRILAVGGDGARFWDQSQGRELMSYRPHGAILSVDFSPSGERVVTTGSDRSIKLWRRHPETGAWGAEVKLIGEHTGTIRVAKFAPAQDDSILVSVGDDAQAVIWHRDDSSGWQAVRSLRGHSGAIQALSLSPDGRWIATGSEDQTIRVWDSSDGTLQTVLSGHRGTVRCLSFSADSERLISGGSDNRAILWDVAQGAPLMHLVGHSAAINSVAFSPDGWRALTGSQDNTIKLWDSSPFAHSTARHGHELLSLAVHQREVTAVEFSPDGKQLLSVGRDGQALLWNSIDVPPAFGIGSKIIRSRSDDRSIPLFQQADFKHATYQSFGGWQIELELADAPAESSGTLLFDPVLAAAYGLQHDAGLIRFSPLAGPASHEPAIEVAELDGSAAGHRLRLVLRPTATPAAVKALVRSLAYRCDPAVDDTQSRHLTLRLYLPGQSEPVDAQQIEIQGANL